MAAVSRSDSGGGRLSRLGELSSCECLEAEDDESEAVRDKDGDFEGGARTLFAFDAWHAK
jgi:hypothetical protein